LEKAFLNKFNNFFFLLCLKGGIKEGEKFCFDFVFFWNDMRFF